MPHTNAFKKLMKSTRKQYLGKEVPKKYKKKYGCLYDEDETKSIAYAIAKARKIKIDKR